MIVEWFLGLSSTFVGWLADFAPRFDEPSWFADPLGPLYTVMGSLGSMGHWVDVLGIGVIVGAVVLLYSIAFLVKLSRVLIAHVPLFGGRG